MVISMSEEEFYSYKSRKFVEESFGGSIPKFLTAFMGGKKLSAEQAEEINEPVPAYHPLRYFPSRFHSPRRSIS